MNENTEENVTPQVGCSKVSRAQPTIYSSEDLGMIRLRRNKG